MEEVKKMMQDTKSSVDNLVPRSEKLLNNTQSQEKAILNMHSDLNGKTNAIMKELREVVRFKTLLNLANFNVVSFYLQG